MRKGRSADGWVNLWMRAMASAANQSSLKWNTFIRLKLDGDKCSVIGFQNLRVDGDGVGVDVASVPLVLFGYGGDGWGAMEFPAFLKQFIDFKIKQRWIGFADGGNSHKVKG